MNMRRGSWRERPLLPRWLLLWPDSQGAIGAAILQEAGPFEGETHLLARMEFTVARHFDISEVDEATARHLGSIHDTPAFVGIETPDDSRHCMGLAEMLLRHGLIMPVGIT